MSDIDRATPEPPERRPPVVLRGNASAHAVEANRLSADNSGMAERHALISIAASLADIVDLLADAVEVMRQQNEPTT